MLLYLLYSLYEAIFFLSYCFIWQFFSQKYLYFLKEYRSYLYQKVENVGTVLRFYFIKGGYMLVPRPEYLTIVKLFVCLILFVWFCLFLYVCCCCCLCYYYSQNDILYTSQWIAVNQLNHLNVLSCLPVLPTVLRSRSFDIFSTKFIVMI